MSREAPCLLGSRRASLSVERVDLRGQHADAVLELLLLLLRSPLRVLRDRLDERVRYLLCSVFASSGDGPLAESSIRLVFCVSCVTALALIFPAR